MAGAESVPGRRRCPGPRMLLAWRQVWGHAADVPRGDDAHPWGVIHQQVGLLRQDVARVAGAAADCQASVLPLAADDRRHGEAAVQAAWGGPTHRLGQPGRYHPPGARAPIARPGSWGRKPCRQQRRPQLVARRRVLPDGGQYQASMWDIQLAVNYTGQGPPDRPATQLAAPFAQLHTNIAGHTVRLPWSRQVTPL